MIGIINAFGPVVKQLLNVGLWHAVFVPDFLKLALSKVATCYGWKFLQGLVVLYLYIFSAVIMHNFWTSSFLNKVCNFLNPFFRNTVLDGHLLT